MLGAVGKTICLFAALTLFACDKTPTKELSPVVAPVVAPVAVLTPQQHLDEYKKNIKSGNLAEANKHSQTFDKNSNEYKESRIFYEKNKIDVRNKARADAAKREVATTSSRKEFARNYEISMLNQGMDMHVSTPGKNATTFRIKYILTSRPLVHQLINNRDFMDGLSAIGFKRFVMTDGYDMTWTTKVD